MQFQKVLVEDVVAVAVVMVLILEVEDHLAVLVTLQVF